ncbi:hypothetical protein TCAL_03486 [Tigriopus californicus]|uniref:Uncharacterized protein n=1 Tax=Tigriopus californicus TaxID=6832 RepID=A0A553PI06_TIGCA|nr:hypothetical protein TCAL_03486 [Tigriopus californicus]|eukprot:TCALIF_03486-PA protein Name:"Protein of unknown function" AED:0.02 eAED:0.02 QI:131/1/0.5/1/1/1/2/0/93
MLKTSVLVLIVTVVFLNSVTSKPFTILNPWTGHVEVEVVQPQSKEDVLQEIDGQTPLQDSEGAGESTPDQKSEYLDDNGNPIFKIYQNQPYGK